MLALVGSAGRWQSIEMVRAEHSSAAPHAIEMETLAGFPNLPAMVRAEHGSAAPHAIRYASAKTAAFGMITTPLCLPLAVAPGHTTQREISAPAATRPPPQTTAWGPTTAPA